MSLNSVYFVLIVLIHGIEGLHAFRPERLCGWRIHLERIYRSTVLPNAEVKVRSCRTSCRADITNDFALTDSLACLEAFCIFREMEICCRIYRIMSDPHGVTSRSFIFHAGHDSVTDGHDRSTFRRSIINTCVRLYLAGDRMLARI